MKKISKYFFSMATSVSLLLVFAVAIGYATFIENSNGTPYAREVVYDALWFEVLLGLLVINLIGSLFYYDIVNRRKFSVWLFHLAFIVMVAGAALTRYIGNEGVMHIREGETTNQLSSDQLMLKFAVRHGNNEVTGFEDAKLGESQQKEIQKSLILEDKKITIKSEAFMPGVRETIVPAEGGEPAIALFVMNSTQQGRDFIVEQGEKIEVENAAFTFNEVAGNDLLTGIEFFWDRERLFFRSSQPLMVARMMEGSKPGQIEPATLNEVEERTLYRTADFTFVVKSYLKQAARNLVQLEDPHQQSSVIQQPQNAVVFSVSDGFNSQRVNLLISEDESFSSAKCRLNDTEVEISYGYINQQLPFSITLTDFQMERYPGSNSPSSYASLIMINDAEKNVHKPYRIYMNNILNYRGYRFFQSSYDQDEKGTVLSVSDDFWGTTISYIGYFLLMAGILLNFFNKNSRFRALIKQSTELQHKRRQARKLVMVIGLLVSSMGLTAQSFDQHLGELNSLPVQDGVQGRIEPFSTFAVDVLRKISKTTTVNDQPAAVVVISMMANPAQWQNEPLIAVKHTELAEELGALNGKIAFNQLFDFEQGGAYRLSEKVELAYQKEVNERSKYDKEVIQLDERVNICYQLFEGDLPRIFPSQGADGHWLTPAQLKEELAVSAVYNEYLGFVAFAVRTGNWNQAIASLKQVKEYQSSTAGLLPSSAKLGLEVFYNQVNIFGQLKYGLMFAGIVFLLICLWDIFYVIRRIAQIEKIALSVFVLLGILYTAGLLLRWYISDHAPWSNGYETMLFVGWAALFSGILVARKSAIAMATSGLLAGIALLVAGMSWMNPEITNLVPVLKSYWLILHVAIITSSYGFLAMAALLGLLNLLLMISVARVNGQAKQQRILANLAEISLIMELAMMIGLLMLTIGCFIGGIWANESWGRYWGWDPKETWALVSIVVYTVILHLRNVPKLNNQLVLSSSALVGFSSIIMTFFGVNYYLSGMHSYGQGTPPPVPVALYFIVPLVALIIFSAYRSEKKRNNSKKKQ